jgi:hypothetical protein
MQQGYAFDRIPEISVWAIHVMSLADPGDRARLFNGLISNIDSLSIPGQAALDEVLSNIEDDPWRTSEKRHALLNKWVSKAMSKDDAMLVIQRLDIAAQHSVLEGQTEVGEADPTPGGRIHQTQSRSFSLFAMLCQKKSQSSGNSTMIW